MDYCTPENCYLVDGTTVPVGNDYPLADERQYWFDPDANSAKEAFLRCYNHRSDRANKITIAANDMEKFSVKNICKQYDLKIRNLFKLINESSS